MFNRNACVCAPVIVQIQISINMKNGYTHHGTATQWNTMQPGTKVGLYKTWKNYTHAMLWGESTQRQNSKF